MKIAVLFASNRHGGKHEEIKQMMSSLNLPVDYDFRESCGCGGCVETNGHPFHGECPVAKCCQDKGFMHCGECPDIPEHCGEADCKKRDVNGFTPCDTCEKITCGNLHAYSYTDPEHGDNPPGARVEQCKKWAKEN